MILQLSLKIGKLFLDISNNMHLSSESQDILAFMTDVFSPWINDMSPSYILYNFFRFILRN